MFCIPSQACDGGGVLGGDVGAGDGLSVGLEVSTGAAVQPRHNARIRNPALLEDESAMNSKNITFEVELMICVIDLWPESAASTGLLLLRPS
jgi:hypothetical protein